MSSEKTIFGAFGAFFLLVVTLLIGGGCALIYGLHWFFTSPFFLELLGR